MKKLIQTASIIVVLLISGCSNNVDSQIMIGDTCWMDGINGSNELLVNISKHPIVFDGWGVNRPLQKAPTRVVVQLSDEKGLIKATAFSDEMLSRVDIVKAFGSHAYDKSGFKVKMNNAKNIPNGEYAISLILINENISLYCNVKKKIIVN